MLILSKLSEFRKISDRLFYSFIFGLCAISSFAQAPATQATVVTTFSPPFTIPLSEIYTSQQLNVLVTAVNGPIPSGKIAVVIQGNNGIRIQNNYVTSGFSLDIAQGAPYQLSGGDLDEIFQQGNFVATGITVAQAFDEGLPPGNYEICFRVYVQGRTTWTPISQAPPLGCGPFIIQDSPNAVTITNFVQPPPFTSDLVEYTYKINATLFSAASRNVRLFLTITGDNGITIRSRQGIITPETLPLQAGIPYMLTSIDLGPYFEFQNLVFSGVSANTVYNGGLPEGNYRFCLRAVDTNGTFVSAGEPSGCSNLINIRLLEPPQLINPQCGTIFKSSATQNIVFSWTPPPGAPPGLAYTLRIVEMIDPGKNPNDAMLTATTPAFFEETTIGATTFLYGPGQPVLEPGRKYAWQVIAGTGPGPDLPNTSSQFRNKGKSAVCWFTWEESLTSINLVIADTGGKKTGDASVSPFTNTEPVPLAAVAGKLYYKFKTFTYVSGLGNKKGQKKNTMKAAGFGGDDIPYNQQPLIDASGSLPLGNVKVSLVMLYLLDGKIGNKEYDASPIKKGDVSIGGSQFDQSFKGHEKVLATTTTSADGSFSFQFVHTEKDLGKYQENINWTSGGGEFFNHMSGTVYKVIRLKVENDYYCSPDINIKVNPWEAVDLGTLISYVKSYDLKITVIATKSSFYKEQLKGSGAVLDMVSTTILRKSKVPAVPYNEGNKISGGNKLKLPGSQDMIASGETGVDGTILVRNLVRHDPDNNQDRYYIVCSTSKTSGLLNYKTKETRYNPFSVQDKKDFPFNAVSYVTLKPKNGIAYNEYFGSDVLWNSEFETKTFTKEIELYPELPRVFGKVYSVLAVDKPMPGEQVALISVYENKPIQKVMATTDSNGRYEFNNLDVGLEGVVIEKKEVNGNTQVEFMNELDIPYRLISAKVKGYKLHVQDIGQPKYGTQLERDFALEPDGRLAGYVVDEAGNAVQATVQVDSIMKKTAPMFKYASSGGSGTKSKGGFAMGVEKIVSYFEMTVPSGKDKTIIIEPEDKGAFYTEVYTVDIPLKSGPKSEIKEFKVYRAQKRIKFRILAGQTSTGKLKLPSSAKPLTNVNVTLDIPNQKLTQKSDAEGYVTFIFENSATDFSFLVDPPAEMDFEPTVYSIGNVPDGKELKEYTPCYLKPATSIEGIVILKGTNTLVKDALVYIDLGNGNKMDAHTDDQGKYVLSKVPKAPQERTVWCSKPGEVPNLITQSKTIMLKDNNTVNFELEPDTEMVIKDIFGFKVVIQEMKKEPDGSRTITKGSLIEIPANENFKLYDEETSLPFSNVKIKKSGIKDASGIPFGVPEATSMALDLQELKLYAHGEFGVVQKMDSNMPLTIQSQDGAGYLEGNVSILMNSFQFSQQYLGLPEGKTYHLAAGSAGGQTGLKTVVATTYPKQKFFITDDKGNDLQYKYLGFKAKADRQQSYLEDDRIVLQTTLSTGKIPGMTPSQIDMQIGPLVVRTDKIEPVTGDNPMNFKLEQWDVVCPKWIIQQNSSGILIPGGSIKTGLIDIPVNNMTILPNKFDASGFDIQSITLSGVAPVNVLNAQNALFGYNSSIGKDQKGHWELRILGENGMPCATLANLPGMEPGASIDFDIFSLISNGEQKVTFSSKYQGTTFHKVLKAKPISFNGGDQYFQMYSTVDLNIPKIAQSSAVLQFEKEGNAIKLKVFPFNVDVEGPGFVKFHTGTSPGDQELKPGHFTAKGDIRDKEGIALDGKLHRTVDKIWLEVDPKGQTMPLGSGNTSLANIEGKMEIDNAVNDWTNFTFSGEMKGFKGMQGNLRKTFTVHGSITADQESIDVKNIPTPFGEMGLTYDIKNARLTGSMELKQSIGPMALNGVANILVDGSGWYFLSGGQLSTPGLGGMAAGMLIGDYNHMPPDVSQKLMQFAYDKNVPPSFASGISGFFFTGEKDIPIINIPDFSIDLGILSATMGAKAGLDGRIWMGFDGSGNEYGIGAMAFAHVYFKAASITCTKLGAEARAELGAKGVYTASNGAFTVNGCGSITITGSAKQCFPTPCWDGICCTGCIGDSISKGVKVDILLDSNGNTDLTFGFGNCSGQPPMASNW